LNLLWNFEEGFTADGFRIGWDTDSTFAYPEGYVDVPAELQAVVDLPATANFIRIAALRNGHILGWYSMPSPAIDSSIDDPVVPGVKSFVQVYPNPVRSSASIKMSLAPGKPCQVVLFDIRGRLVREIYSGPVRNEVSLDSMNLSNGLYFLRVQNASRTETRKLLILK
jgi:hypothetical protein